MISDTTSSSGNTVTGTVHSRWWRIPSERIRSICFSNSRYTSPKQISHFSNGPFFLSSSSCVTYDETISSVICPSLICLDVDVRKSKNTWKQESYIEQSCTIWWERHSCACSMWCFEISPVYSFFRSDTIALMWIWFVRSMNRCNSLRRDCISSIIVSKGGVDSRVFSICKVHLQLYCRTYNFKS